MGRQGELKQRGDDHERRQESRAPFRQRRHRHGDKDAGRAHQEDIAGTEPSDADGLEDGGHAADAERREDRPGHVRLLPAGRADDDRRGQDDPADREQHELKSKSQGEQVRGSLVWVRNESPFERWELMVSLDVSWFSSDRVSCKLCEIMWPGKRQQESSVPCHREIRERMPCTTLSDRVTSITGVDHLIHRCALSKPQGPHGMFQSQCLQNGAAFVRFV